MGDYGIRDLGTRSRFLQLNSANDIHVDSKTHNPANFEVSMPNSVGSHGILRTVPHTVSLPRQFYNIYAPSNAFIIWRRKTKMVDLGGGLYFNTGEPNWTPTLVTVPPGLYTRQSLVAWFGLYPYSDWFSVTWDSEAQRLNFAGNYYMFDQWGQRDELLTLPDFMPQFFLTEPPGSHFFDILGLGSSNFEPSGPSWLSYAFNEQVPSTGDSIRGTPIEQATIVVPMFRTDVHDMGSYAYAQYSITNANPLNLTGPVWVNVIIDELGDNSTIDTETGKPLSVIACIPMTDVPIGGYATRVIRDCDAEGIQYPAERTVRSFRVRCEDVNGNVLTLPRNWPVLLRLQVLQVQ